MAAENLEHVIQVAVVAVVGISKVTQQRVAAVARE
jgi:hypothetical protein